MASNSVEDYGWKSPHETHAAAYLTPQILAILAGLNVRRVADLGAGNGALVAALVKSGYQAVGIEYDEKGVGIARNAYPGIPFYNYGVQHNPADLLEREKYSVP